MHPVDILASTIPEDEAAEVSAGDLVENVCAVTGQTTLCLPRKRALGKSFTNIDLLAAPQSEWVGVNAFMSLKYKWQRMSCWLLREDSFQRIDKPTARGLVLDGVPDGGHWCGYITTSYKKHGILRAVINSGSCGTWAFDETRVDCSEPDVTNAWYERIFEAFAGHGIARSTLETLSISTYSLRDIGADNWLEYSAWAKNKLRSPLYRLLVYLLPARKDIPK